MTSRPRARVRSQFLWSCIGIGLVCLHLILTLILTGQTQQFVLNVLFWAAISSLLWQRRASLYWRSESYFRYCGLLLLTLIVLKSCFLNRGESAFVRLMPGWIALSLGLITSGYRLQQYSQEFLLIMTMMLPQGWLSRLMQQPMGLPLQTLIAQSATYLLHYGGFEVMRQGTQVILPRGAVNVDYGCTGVPLLILLLQLSVLFVLMFPTTVWQKWLVPLWASIIAFSLSSVRVAIMALAVNSPQVFDFWHGKIGSQWISTLSILVFAISCQYLTRQRSED